METETPSHSQRENYHSNTDTRHRFPHIPTYTTTQKQTHGWKQRYTQTNIHKQAHTETPQHRHKKRPTWKHKHRYTHTHPSQPTAASQINLPGKERNWVYWTPTLCQTPCRNFTLSFNLHKATLKSEMIIPTFTDKNKDGQRWTAQAFPVISRKEIPTSYDSDAATFPSPCRAFLYIVGHRNFSPQGPPQPVVNPIWLPLTHSHSFLS